MSDGQEAVTKWKMAHNPLLKAVSQFEVSPEEKKVEGKTPDPDSLAARQEKADRINSWSPANGAIGSMRVPNPSKMDQILDGTDLMPEDKKTNPLQAPKKTVVEDAVQHSGVLATGTRSTHDKLPPVYTDQVADFQDQLAQGDSKEAKALRVALDSQKGGHGSWGPKTQAAFEAACEAAGVDPKTVDFTKPDNKALETLQAHIKGKPAEPQHAATGLDQLTPTQTQQLQDNMVAAGLLTKEQANGKWGEEQLNAVHAMIDKNNKSPEAMVINSNNNTISFDEFVKHPTDVNKGPLYFVEYTKTYLDQVNDIALKEARHKLAPQYHPDLDILSGLEPGRSTPPIIDSRSHESKSHSVEESGQWGPTIIDSKRQHSNQPKIDQDPLRLSDKIPDELLASLKQSGISGGAAVNENGTPPGGSKSAARGIA